MNREDDTASGVGDRGRVAGPLDPTSAVLDKLMQTAREAEALLPTMSKVPDEVVWQRPGDAPSIAELLWFIHLADEFRFRPVVDAIISGREPHLSHINLPVLLETDPAPDDDLPAVLATVVESRTKLLDRFEQFSPRAWTEPSIFVEGMEVTGLRFAEDIVAHDSEILREIGHRLLASDMR